MLLEQGIRLIMKEASVYRNNPNLGYKLKTNLKHFPYLHHASGVMQEVEYEESGIHTDGAKASNANQPVHPNERNNYEKADKWLKTNLGKDLNNHTQYHKNWMSDDGWDPVTQTHKQTYPSPPEHVQDTIMHAVWPEGR